jgi:hypothetical protein
MFDAISIRSGTEENILPRALDGEDRLLANRIGQSLHEREENIELRWSRNVAYGNVELYFALREEMAIQVYIGWRYEDARQVLARKAERHVRRNRELGLVAMQPDVVSTIDVSDCPFPVGEVGVEHVDIEKGTRLVKPCVE